MVTRQYPTRTVNIRTKNPAVVIVCAVETPQGG